MRKESVIYKYKRIFNSWTILNVKDKLGGYWDHNY